MTLVNRGHDFALRIAACVAADWRLVAEMAAWRATLPVLKRVVPVRALATWMVTAPRHTSSSSTRDERVARVRQIFSNGGRLLVSSNCLERSLVMYRLLAREGADVALVLGVRHNESNLAGHAWCEMNGMPLGERHDEPYKTVLAFRPHESPSAAWSSRPTAT